MAFWKAILEKYRNMVILGMYDDSHMSYSIQNGATGSIIQG